MRKMTNKEKYTDEIIKIAVNNDYIAVDKKKQRPVPCSEISCEQCKFCHKDCVAARKEWMDECYIDPDDWIEKYYDLAKNNHYVRAIVFPKSKICIVCDQMCKTGKAKCAPKDEFCGKIGIAIAYARYKGIKIPDSVLGER